MQNMSNKEKLRFFRRYMLSGMRFLSKEKPEIWQEYLDQCEANQYREEAIKNLSIYTNWLFEYTFGDMV